ncbi:protein transport protein HofQ [Cricetibacter osteomyelitidis]|uniref:Protein transport protein HofQ n=1 Tax=Cricetibacter osteomyelitidis TaxID=1521931 RepID=A0A4R2T7M3_9PAST|nr:type IV pilus secretin PilQ [Cricetibacter osteomyelitidis]TCP97691.1 protein transport protein HofQ [Cricetibacter osteomyelitidis]
MKAVFYFLTKCGLILAFFYNIAWANNETIFSVRLQQAPIVASLQQIALEQGIDLIVDDDLQGTVSLQLDNTDFDRLIRAVARIKNLSLEQDNGIYYLHNPSKEERFAQPMNLPNMAEIPNNLTALESKIITTSIKLQFAKASEVMKSLTTGNGSLLSLQGSISFDDRSNLLIIRDESEHVKQIKKLVGEMDKPIEQIAIEARIVTISDESLKELGVRWGIFNQTGISHRVSGSLEANGFDVTNQLNVNFPTSSAASVALQVAKINGRLLDLELTALERENNVEIIASPRLLTTNKKSASIKQGTEIPYVINNNKNETQSVEFREAVLGLEVTPHISKDNSILLDLIVSQNSPNAIFNSQTNQFTTIDKQEINTQVFAKDGETIVLGGVFHDSITKNEDKVPLLGDIPIIKHAFRSESEKHQKRELVIFVTPHILKQGQSLDEWKKIKLKKQ